jgi:hypothetical protein
MRWFITTFALILSTATATACINDREVDSREREFKSHYLAPRLTEPPPSPDSSNLPLVAAGAGLMFLCGAAVVTILPAPTGRHN